MSGFGHRVYKNYDPRAKVIRKLAEEVFSIVGRDPLIEVFVLQMFPCEYAIRSFSKSGLRFLFENCLTIIIMPYRWLLLWRRLPFQMSILSRGNYTQMLTFTPD